MKCTIIFLCAAFVVTFPAHSTPAAAERRAGGAPERRLHRFSIKWGLVTKTRQVWDGRATLDTGRIVEVTPFIRHEIPYDALRDTETSWRSTTYIDAEGIFLTVRAPMSATVRIETATGDFAFGMGELEPGGTRQHLDGDVEIRDVTDETLFRIAGLEKGSHGQGTAAILPDRASAGTLGTWTILYTAPAGGVPVGGGVRISWHFTRTWGKPQFTDPKAKNYVSVSTTGRCRLDWTSEHQGLLEYPFTGGRILVRVLDTPLREGEQIRVVLGDTHESSPGFEAPVIAEPAACFRVEACTEVEEGRFTVYRRLETLPQVEILPLPDPKRLFVVAPSQVQAGMPFDVNVVVEDAFRNVVTSFEGTLDILVDDRVARQIAVTPQNAGLLSIPDMVLQDPGSHKVTVRQKDGGLAGRSNPVKCVAGAPSRWLVWGELHGHTELSDGYGSADDYMRFARQRALLDFAAITDHDVELDAPDYHVAEMWREVNAAVRRHHDPPRFCTIPAYEWSPARVTLSTMAPYGDHNVYYSEPGGPIFQAETPGTHTLPALYRRLDAVRNVDAQVISHVGGAIGNWDDHDPGLEHLAEIYSVHGSFEAFGEIALQRGYTVGFVAVSDSHCGQIGGFPPGDATGHYTHGGLTAAWVSGYSRRDLFDALAERRVYATSGPRIFVDFCINGEPMGAEIQTGEPPVLAADVRGTAPLLSVEVVKNGRVIYTWTNEYTDGPELTFLWGNRVEPADLTDFDRSLWSYDLRHVNWQGGIRADRGALTLKETCSFDYPKDHALAVNGTEIQWRSETRGDWDGIRMSLEDRSAPLTLRLGEYRESIAVADLVLGVTKCMLGRSDSLVLVNGTPRFCDAAFRMTDRTILHRRNYY